MLRTWTTMLEPTLLITREVSGNSSKHQPLISMVNKRNATLKMDAHYIYIFTQAMVSSHHLTLKKLQLVLSLPLVTQEEVCKDTSQTH